MDAEVHTAAVYLMEFGSRPDGPDMKVCWDHSYVPRALCLPGW